MAPSRRKGGSKAAGSAAARRQWNVGDLVLAKVKGFPAWPATVSEPEKWGYSTDRKKVLVYFFGTQQIAFCNHADVEAFTEEKKQSLLGKRHGKGSDFVRAVNEINDIYEKFKNQDQSDVTSSGNDVSQTTGGYTVDTSTTDLPTDEAEFSAETLNLRLNASDSARDRSNPTLPVDDAVKEVDSLHNKGSSLDRPTESVVIAEVPPLATSTSRKRSGSSRLQSSVTQWRGPSVRRMRNSSRMEPGLFQNVVMPNNDGSNVCENIAGNGAQDGSYRRNKLVMKSPAISDYNDEHSPALASNDTEDNGLEITMVGSDPLSPNEGSTIDSGSKLEHSETVECLEGDEVLSKGIDLQMTAGVFKKKRKPNRQRGMNGAVKHIARLEKEACFKPDQNSKYICEKANEGDCKDGGDEHLPLVKRARVRMGKPLSVEKLNRLQVEEKPSNEVATFSAGQISLALNCDSEENGDRSSVLVKGTSHNTPPSKDSTQPSENWAHLWKVRKNPSFGCSVADESALPPSKRLHRALEAMSANVAEEGEASIEASPGKSSINECCISSMSRFPGTAEESREGDGLGLESLNCSDKNSTQMVGASEDSICSNPITSDKTTSSVGKEIYDKPTEHFKRGDHGFDNDFPAETRENGCNLIGPSACTNTIQTVANIESLGGLLPNLVREQFISTSHLGSYDQFLNKNAEDGSKDIQFVNHRAENSDKEFATSEHARLCPDTGAGDVSKISGGDDTQLHHYSSGGTDCENIMSLKSQVDRVNDMFEVVGNKDELKELQENTSSGSVSSDDHLTGKVASYVHSSPGQTDGVDCSVRLSSPSTLICHISTSESADLPKSDCGSGHNVHLDQNKSFRTLIASEVKSEPVVTQQPKVNSKWSNYTEAQAALSSFKAILETLTGKRESIGQATRTAMDCGKLGVAPAKVVGIIVRKVESESSLDRRVDLFFLVDSITHSSRNMKGDVGGMYLSAIQSSLPRLLSAAAPPGSAAQANRRQCKKVLRVWLDRRILPESVVRYHIRELDSHGGAYSRCSSRTERSLDDPVREMGGMLVDEYGSNSSFQLPGFSMPHMLKGEDDGSDSDFNSFEAVTPDHKPHTPEEQETIHEVEKHRCILEDVDGELEMEDVAPVFDVDIKQASIVAGANSSHPSHDMSSTSASSDALYLQNKPDSSWQPVLQHSVSSRAKPKSYAMRYHAPEWRDHRIHDQIPDSASSYNVQRNNGVRFHSKPYPPRPPHHGPSDQFSYVQVDHHVKPGRFNGKQKTGGRNFYNNHDRIKPAPYEGCEDWRFHEPFFGPRYPDKGKASYPHVSYIGPSRESSKVQNQYWSLPPRAVHHRYSMPMRHHPYEGQDFWWPR